MEERPWCAAPSLPTGGVELHSPGNMPLRVKLMLHAGCRTVLSKNQFGAHSKGQGLAPCLMVLSRQEETVKKGLPSLRLFFFIRNDIVGPRSSSIPYQS